MRGLAFSCVLLVAAMLRHAAAYVKPNILLIWADDVGWADLQRHDPAMRTPSLERLAAMGMFMNNSYVLMSCVPSRSAMMTGRHPHIFGLQKNSIMGNRLAWLNETETLLPQVLKGFGYTTHMIGKWHLGYCDWDLTPTGRGFDTFYGMMKGAADHYSHSDKDPDTYDFWNDRNIDWSAYGNYSTDLFSARARQIIQNASPNQPWFLFLSYQAAHSPFEVPEHYVTKYCSHVTNRHRQIHCAMVAAMDEGIGLLLDDLETKDVMDDTLILFMSDNGGPIQDDYSSNYPLRGGKQGLWEGGTKSYTVYKGPGNMAATNVTFSGLFHAVDILPTLATEAGRGSYTKPAKLDGYSLFWSLQLNHPSPRQRMLYNVNDWKKTRAIRLGYWKLLKGSPGNENGWYPSPDQRAQGAVTEHISKTAIASSTWHMFNLYQDPYERKNLYDIMLVENPKLVNELKNRLQKYWDEMVPFQWGEKSSLAGELQKQYHHVMPGWCNVTLSGL